MQMFYHNCAYFCAHPVRPKALIETLTLEFYLHSPTNHGKEKKRTLCFASFCLIMGLNHGKSMTVLKLCKKSSKCNVAGHCSFIRLEMTMV